MVRLFSVNLMLGFLQDTLTGVTTVVRNQYMLYYEDGSTSKEADANEMVTYADGEYTMYLHSNISKKMWIRNEDEMLEPKYDADAEPMLEKVLVISFYEDGESGGTRMPILETKYQLTLPSEAYLGK